MQLKNQVAVITGGANGIGRATAERFGAEGAKIVIGDLLEAPGLQAVAELREKGIEATYGQLEASSRESNESLARLAVETYGGLDVLVTAAGISHSEYVSGDREGYLKWMGANMEASLAPAHAFAQLESDAWQRVLDVNLTGTFYAMQAVVGQMLELGTHGRIVTIASIAAKNPDAGPTAYTVSKAGVWMLTKKSARQLAPANIRVNSIGPGYIETHMTSMFAEIPEAEERIMAQVPMGRKGQPEEIASAALFLVSDESSYMTGEILHPDGGYFTE
jgi:NAD(P)-dependent dehydrogenase (short-subunit alcohol dehydrogenase family)